MPSRRHQQFLNNQKARRRKLQEKHKQHVWHPIVAQRQFLKTSQNKNQGSVKRDRDVRTLAETKSKLHRMHIADIDSEMAHRERSRSTASLPEENPMSVFGFNESARNERRMREEREREKQRQEDSSMGAFGFTESARDDDDDELSEFLGMNQSPKFKKKKVRIAKERDWIPTRETIRHVIKSHLKNLRLVTVRRTYPNNRTNPRLHILVETPIRKTLVTLSATWNPQTKTLSHLKRLSTFQKVKTVDEWHTLHRKSRGAKFLPCH